MKQLLQNHGNGTWLEEGTDFMYENIGSPDKCKITVIPPQSIPQERLDWLREELKVNKRNLIQNSKKMTLKKEFNQELVTVNPNIEFGYKMENGCQYDNYLSNNSFSDFLKEMENNYNEIYKSFKNGDGKELEEKLMRGKLTPPKMASIASSSRFAYLIFRKMNPELFGQITGNETNYDIIFEGKLKSILNISFAKPNIDVILKSKDTIVFIEVKCQEILDSHKAIFPKSYKDSLEKIFGDNNVSINSKNKIELSTTIKQFDIKQSICHILGIYNFVYSNDKRASIKSNEIEIEWTSDMENIYFVNLFFNPQKLNNSNLTKAYQNAISEAKKEPIEDYFKKLLESNKVDKKVNFKHLLAYTTDIENGNIELIN
jgi:hypothetical protein